MSVADVVWVTKFAEAYHTEESDCLKDPRTGRSRVTKLRRCGLCDHGNETYTAGEDRHAVATAFLG